jgi:hypothetical protein
MYFPMPGLDIPAKEADPAHGALIRRETDNPRVDTANPFLEIPQGQGSVSEVVEDYAFKSAGFERSEYVACGNGDTFRRLVAHIMIDINEKKGHVLTVPLPIES